MPALVSDIITGAADHILDPSNRRITRDLWLLFYNETQLEIATELKCLEVDATFDILTAFPAQYAYPDDSVALRYLWYNPSPSSDPQGFRQLFELFSDEWRGWRRWRYPSGEPTSYIARQSFFELIPAPQTQVLGGGQITYYRIPEFLTVEANQVLEIPTFLSTFVVDGMVPRGLAAMRQFAAAAEARSLWRESLAALKPSIQDRSDDRRSALRPAQLKDPFAGMI